MAKETLNEAGLEAKTRLHIRPSVRLKVLICRPTTRDLFKGSQSGFPSVYLSILK